MSRLVKHIGGRSTPEDDTKVLMAVPFFPGEKIKSVNMNCYFASGDASAIDQPGEINWYGITVPWSLYFATPMIVGGLSPASMGGADDVDLLYARWLHDVADDGGEVFGGDVDSDPELTEGEASHAVEELIDSGPIGVKKWFSREVIMQPFAAEGNTVIRFGDSFSATPTGIQSHNLGGLLLFGVVRFQADVETQFNVELDDATSREGMGLLIGGDYTKVKAKIEGDTSSLGDYIRTVLFGGDNFIENNTLKTQAGKSYVKASIFIESPISRSH